MKEIIITYDQLSREKDEYVYWLEERLLGSNYE